MEKNNILIITPAYNEEQNIEYVINDIKTYAKNFDWLIINDASTDATLDIIKNNNINSITNSKNSGYYTTLQNGIKYAYEHGYEYVITFDSDRQHKAEEIPNLAEKIKTSNLDLVLASRYLIQNNNSNIFQKIGIILSQKVIRSNFNQEITDATSGFRCMNRKVMEEIIKLDEIKTLELSFIVYLLKNNYKIGEIPTQMRERTYGTSMFKGIKKRIKYTKLIIDETKKQLKGK